MSDPVILNGLIDVPQEEVAFLLEAGQLLMELGRPKDAETVFVGVSALLPKSDVPLVLLGNLLFSQGKFQRALKFHQDALKARPDSALAQAHIGEALMFLKKIDDGLAALHKAIEMDADSPAAAFARALIESHESGELAG